MEMSDKASDIILTLHWMGGGRGRCLRTWVGAISGVVSRMLGGVLNRAGSARVMIYLTMWILGPEMTVLTISCVILIYRCFCCNILAKKFQRVVC